MISEGDGVICLDCAHEQKTTFCPPVNVTIDTEMRENVLSGDHACNCDIEKGAEQGERTCDCGCDHDWN